SLSFRARRQSTVEAAACLPEFNPHYTSPARSGSGTTKRRSSVDTAHGQIHRIVAGTVQGFLARNAKVIQPSGTSGEITGRKSSAWRCRCRVPRVCFNRGTPSFFHELCDHSGSLGSCTLFGIDVRRGNPHGRGNDRGRGNN